MYLRFTVRVLVESFVIPHIQGHVTNLAFETLFVPDLKEDNHIYSSVQIIIYIQYWGTKFIL